MSRIRNGAFAVILLFAQHAHAKELSLRVCGNLYGKSGPGLPQLFQQALKVLPGSYPVRRDDVFYIEDMTGFLDCLGIVDSPTRDSLFADRAFVFRNAMPMFFNGSIEQNRIPASAFERDPGQSYLKYLFASFIGHEWLHATGEKLEGPALEFELSLMVSFRERLPDNRIARSYLSNLRSMIDAANAQELQFRCGKLAPPHGCPDKK